jgi:hypothetical protein
MKTVAFWDVTLVVSQMGNQRSYCFHLSRTLKAESSSEKFVASNQTSWRHNQEDRSHNIRRNENLGSRKIVTAFGLCFDARPENFRF